MQLILIILILFILFGGGYGFQHYSADPLAGGAIGLFTVVLVVVLIVWIVQGGPPA